MEKLVICNLLHYITMLTCFNLLLYLKTNSDVYLIRGKELTPCELYLTFIVRSQFYLHVFILRYIYLAI